MEETYRGSLKQSIRAGKVAQAKLNSLVKGVKEDDLEKDLYSSDEEEESESEESDMDGDVDSKDGDAGNKPIDRLKKLTINQRNQKKVRRGKLDAQETKAKERREQRQYDKVGVFINEDIREVKFSKAKIEKREKEDKLEKEI